MRDPAPELLNPGLLESSHEKWMRAALAEAEAAAAEGEVPVGCVVVHEGRIIGRGHNRIESLKDPTAHAEIVAIGAAATTLENWRLSGATVYVTIEPCLMCAGALTLARPDLVVFGARDPKFGCLGSRYDIARDNRFNHKLKVVEGVLAAEAGVLMKRFFRGRRSARQGTGREGSASAERREERGTGRKRGKSLEAAHRIRRGTVPVFGGTSARNARMHNA